MLLHRLPSSETCLLPIRLTRSFRPGRDNFCQDGQIAVVSDKKGNGDTACTGGKKRSYCCDAAGDSYSPVPWTDLFDTTDELEGDAATFNVEFDQDEDSAAGQYGEDDDEDDGAGTTSNMPEDDDENDEAFGEVLSLP